MTITEKLAALRVITPIVHFEWSSPSHLDHMYFRMRVDMGSNFTTTREVHFDQPMTDADIINIMNNMHRELCSDVIASARQSIDRNKKASKSALQINKGLQVVIDEMLPHAAEPISED